MPYEQESLLSMCNSLGFRTCMRFVGLLSPSLGGGGHFVANDGKIEGECGQY